MSNRIIAVDFETLYCTKTGYGIRELGAAAYVRHERFDPYLISVSDGTETWSGQPRNFNFDALEGATLLAHNAGFDSLVLEEMVKRGLAPKVEFKGWNCTANLSVYLCGRRSLAQAAEFLLGISPDKSIREKADGKAWADLTKEDGGESMLAYARQDALLCWTLWAKYSHFWPEHERQLSRLTIKQCHRGCQIDVENLDNQRKVAHNALKQAESALPWVAEGRPPTSPKAVCEKCRAEGIPGPPVKSHAPPDGGEAAYEAWETAYAPKFRWVKAYTDFRVINKYLTQLETIKTRLSEDGVLSYDLLYGGAHTMRWSGGGGLNMQNLRKDSLDIDADGWLITDGVKTPAHRLDVRSLFIARPGKKMVISDLSQVEPRCLAWLTGDAEMMASMASGASPYQAYAESKLGWVGGDLKKADKVKYAHVKAAVLGLSYGAGWKTYIRVAKLMANLDICESDPMEVQEETREGTPIFNEDGSPKLVSGYGHTAKRLVREFREANPKLTALWRSLEDAFRASVGGTFEMTLPSGRKMRYPQVKEEWTRVLEEEGPGAGKYKNKRTVKAEVMHSGRSMRIPLWGSALCENLTQAVARDCFAQHLLALESTPGIQVLFHIHDEAVVECDPEITAADVEKIMSQTPEWLSGCPLAAEAKEVKAYCK